MGIGQSGCETLSLCDVNWCAESSGPRLFILSKHSLHMYDYQHVANSDKSGSTRNLQEVTVKGQKIVYKDVIEPLESVSVTIIATEKEKLNELGTPQEVRVRPDQPLPTSDPM